MYICIVNYLLNMSYNDFLSLGFDQYRRWFNRNFKLSFKGKFCGLSRLGVLLDLFVHKLSKLLKHENNKMLRPLGNVLTIKLRGNIVKLFMF